ncbi:MAG TPA: 50S ribosomal protein L10 [Candidatus Baltobacteraceae bacterium]|nr:50S ribosomal protein L10 [Candidatus Baltobacteraceae bacterium]
MPTAKKEATIEELRKRLADAKHMFFTNYAGLSVEEISKLRNELRKDGNSYAVVKNTLFAIAAGDELAKALESFLAGPTGVVFAPLDPVAPAKALKAFGDGVKAIEVKAAYVDGKILDRSQVEALASLPPKAELQAKLLGLFVSPLRGFAGVLAANPSGFVRVLSAREKQLAESAS